MLIQGAGAPVLIRGAGAPVLIRGAGAPVLIQGAGAPVLIRGAENSGSQCPKRWTLPHCRQWRPRGRGSCLQARPPSASPSMKGRGGARKPNPVRAKASPAAELRSGATAGPGSVRSAIQLPNPAAGTGGLGTVPPRSPSPPWMGGTRPCVGKVHDVDSRQARAGVGSPCFCWSRLPSRSGPFVATASAPAKRRRLNTFPARESRGFAAAADSDNFRHRDHLDEVRADEGAPAIFLSRRTPTTRVFRVNGRMAA